MGQSRIIKPFVSHCYECSLEMMPPQRRYNICTLAETPRVPEHCIEYVLLVSWEKEQKRKFNSDSKDDMTWIYERALKRAEAYGIQGVTYMLTMGVTKNIIPAVATTNAIIAASCINEALKVFTGAAVNMQNEMQYFGQTGVNGNTLDYPRRDVCSVCQNKPIDMTVRSDEKLSDFLSQLTKPPLRLKKPSARSSVGSLYMSSIPSLEVSLRPRLEMTFK